MGLTRRADRMFLYLLMALLLGWGACQGFPFTEDWIPEHRTEADGRP